MLESAMSVDFNQWVGAIGYIGIAAVVLLEMGVFFGFFLPGDSLVFAGGLLAAKGVFNIWLLMAILIGTAIIGYFIGYWFGNKLGYWLMRRKESFWFKKSYIEKAHQFFEKHGGKALILGRLIAIVRTFVPIVAGMVEMPFQKYIFCNVVGALIWGGGITLVGYYIGARFPFLSNFILPVVCLAIIVTLMPAVYQFWRYKRAAKNSSDTREIE